MSTLKSIVVWVLTCEARLLLARLHPKVIALTGSVGKTTTKDAVYSALSPTLRVRKSVKSFNSDIGVPLTILGLSNPAKNPFVWLMALSTGLFRAVITRTYPDWLVLEVGADRPGDIARIARWLRPDIVIITGVPDIPAHLEYFRSPEELLAEKRSLVGHLKAGGKLILNGDDERMRILRSEFRGAAITYGLGIENDFAASHETILYEGGWPQGMQFRVNYAGSSVPLVVRGALGVPRMYAAAAALAAATACGVDLVTAGRGLAKWQPPQGRMRILPAIKGAIIIDDTYNSSPSAALSALDTLRAVEAKRRIAVLGDMLELGRMSAEGHRVVGERAAACADMLITVGFRARAIAEAALDAGMSESQIRQYEIGESARAGKELESILSEGDVVLVKGSQAMRMERTVLEIMNEPERAEELLVRMDDEWRNR